MSEEHVVWEASRVQLAIRGMLGFKRWVFPTLVILGLLGCGLGLVPECPVVRIFKWFIASFTFSLSTTVLLVWMSKRKLINRICDCLLREDVVDMRGCLKKVVKRELTRVAGIIQDLQQSDTLGGNPQAAEIRENSLKPLFAEAKYFGLLDEDLKERGYKALFLKREEGDDGK